jgi:hypothetical protein
MIRRTAFSVLHDRLAQFDSVALLGPRQVGKTTLAREFVAAVGDGARYLDLEKREDRRQLDDPDEYFDKHAGKLIVLDEIQRVPGIFQALRSQIDACRRVGDQGGKFLLLGSASMDLLRQSSESLAGRISFIELTPLSLSEIVSDRIEASLELASAARLPDYKLLETRPIASGAGPSVVSAVTDELWLKGGFPESYRRQDEWSLQWRQDFILTYLERDLPQFGLRVAADNLDRFWRLLANDQGGLFQAQRYAQAIGVSGHTIANYLDILEKLMLVRRLAPWSSNGGKRLVKSPRPYIRDTGILHALLNLQTTEELHGHRIAGKSWEGFAIEALVGAAGERTRPYFYRTNAGAEADLVLEFAWGRCWAIEITLGNGTALDRGFYNAVNDLKAERSILVYTGPERVALRHGVEAMPLIAAIAEIRTAVGGGRG